MQTIEMEKGRRRRSEGAPSMSTNASKGLCGGRVILGIWCELMPPRPYYKVDYSLSVIIQKEGCSCGAVCANVLCTEPVDVLEQLVDPVGLDEWRIGPQG